MVMNDNPPTDFLRGTPVIPDADTGVDAILNLEYEAIKAIRRELLKQNPSVMANCVVQNTTQGSAGLVNRVSDQLAHQVFFQINGKPVPIYKLFVVSTNGNQTINLVNPPATSTDGLDTVGNTLYYFPVELNTIWIRSTNATPFIVNGPIQAGEGALFLWGFTTPDVLMPDWE